MKGEVRALRADGIPLYAVCVGDRVITGFRYPTGRLGQGDNRTERGEIRVSWKCIAVLGDRDAAPYKWSGDRLSPDAIVRQLGPTARVVTVGSSR